MKKISAKLVGGPGNGDIEHVMADTCEIYEAIAPSLEEYMTNPDYIPFGVITHTYCNTGLKDQNRDFVFIHVNEENNNLDR